METVRISAHLHGSSRNIGITEKLIGANGGYAGESARHYTKISAASWRRVFRLVANRYPDHARPMRLQYGWTMSIARPSMRRVELGPMTFAEAFAIAHGVKISRLPGSVSDQLTALIKMPVLPQPRS